MRKLILCLTVLCLFTVSTVESLACMSGGDDCFSHEVQSKKNTDAHNDACAHSCCHAHLMGVKEDKVAVQIVLLNSYDIEQHRLYSQFEPGALLEPPSQT